MRPVTRGLPAHYPNYPVTPIPYDVQQSISFLFSAMRNKIWSGRGYVEHLQGDIEGVYDTLENQGLEFTWDGFGGLPEFKTIFEVDNYMTEAEQTFNRLADDDMSNADELIAAAQNYVRALQVQIDWYQAAFKPHKNRITKEYTRARGDLLTNIGQYCSYCEMPLAASLAVEHMLPKTWFWRTSVNWDNFLLACPICNSIKNDKPTTAQGQAVARQTVPLPTWTDVENGARSLFLWPSDATNYTSFAANYAFIMYLVLRYAGGGIYREVALTPAQIDPLVRLQGLELAPTDDSGLFKVWMQPWLGETPATPDVVNGLNRNGGDLTPIWAIINGVDNATHPNLLADAAQYRLPGGAAVDLLPVTPNAIWDLRQMERYVIGTAGGISVRLPDGSTIRPAVAWRTAVEALASGLLPDAIATAIGVDPLGRTIRITKTGLNEFTADVYRFYRVQNVGGVMRITARQIYPLELRLVGANARAQYTVDQLALNRMQPKDPKSADRRTARRIRAFFAALEALYCLGDAIALGNAQLLTDLQNMIIQNMIATGFWTVWNQVFSNYVSGTWTGKGALLTAMNNAFAGTR